MKNKKNWFKRATLLFFVTPTPPPSLNWLLFRISSFGDHEDLVFTSNDAKCPSLYPTCDDTIPLKSLLSEII